MPINTNNPHDQLAITLLPQLQQKLAQPNWVANIVETMLLRHLTQLLKSTEYKDADLDALTFNIEWTNWVETIAQAIPSNQLADFQHESAFVYQRMREHYQDLKYGYDLADGLIIDSHRWVGWELNPPIIKDAINILEHHLDQPIKAELNIHYEKWTTVLESQINAYQRNLQKLLKTGFTVPA